MNYKEIKKIKSKRRINSVIFTAISIIALIIVVLGISYSSFILVYIAMMLSLAIYVFNQYVIKYNNILSEYANDVREFRERHYLLVLIDMLNRNEFDKAHRLYNQSNINRYDINSIAFMELCVKQILSNDEVAKLSITNMIKDIENVYMEKYIKSKNNFN